MPVLKGLMKELWPHTLILGFRELDIPVLNIYINSLCTTLGLVTTGQHVHQIEC